MYKIIDFNELFQYDFTLNNIYSVKQRWSANYKFNFIGNPKQQHNLSYYHGCKGEYTLKNGSTLFAKPGDIVYAPMGSEYNVRFFEPKNCTENTIGINFQAFDMDNNVISFDKDVKIIHTNSFDYYYLKFCEIADSFNTIIKSPSKSKSILYTILTDLSSAARQINVHSKKFQRISRGIEYLESEDNYNLSINEIAALCNVSEIYFRKLFKQYSGVSPVDYRLNAKIIRAKQLLGGSPMNIKEVSEYLGFNDPAYFSRIFKKKTGITPKEYEARNGINYTF